jgi:hypothetical protein
MEFSFRRLTDEITNTLSLVHIGMAKKNVKLL